MAVATGTAILAAAGIGAGASILGSSKQSSAAKSAVNTQAESAAQATQAELEMYYKSREDMAPWRKAGAEALGGYDEMIQKYLGVTNQYQNVLMNPDQYLQSPGYNWLLEQGNLNLARGASASGKLGSGQYSKDIMAYGQGLASQDYNNYLNQLLNSQNWDLNQAGTAANMYGNLAGLGQNAAIQGGQQAVATGQSVGQNYLAAGNAQAGNYINQANAQTGLYGNLSNIGSNALNQYMQYQGMQQQPTTNYSNDYNLPAEYGYGTGR